MKRWKLLDGVKKGGEFVYHEAMEAIRWDKKRSGKKWTMDEQKQRGAFLWKGPRIL
jgi:hypothetical protein